MNKTHRENLNRILSGTVSLYETYPGAFSVETFEGKVTVTAINDAPTSTLRVQYCSSPVTNTSRLTTCYLRTEHPAYAPLKRLYDLSRERWKKDEAELHALLELLK